MTEPIDQNIKVAGAGVAELPVPRWTWILKCLICGALFFLVLAAVFTLNGWSWVTEGTTELAAWTAFTSTAAAAAVLALIRSGVLNTLLNIRKITGPERPRWVYGGARGFGRFVALGLLAALTAANAGLIALAIHTCPLPEVLSKAQMEITPPSPDEGLTPVFFWDYGTWIDPNWLEKLNLVIPYEKGPPQKLLPKIYFENPTTHVIAVELHGKRPRVYPPSEVQPLFDSPTLHPRDWPLVWRLEREAGLATSGLNPVALFLIRIHQQDSGNITQAVGVPWESGTDADDVRLREGAAADDRAPASKASGHVFFWGPDGSVFQVKCAKPCALSRMLELVQFPPDPKATRAGRIEWTRKELRRLLELPMPAGDTERRRHENLLSLYLVSMLTQDPRDPEAFFHLGKLARNRETALAAISYGRDLGLEPAKLAELESVAERLRF